MVSSSPDCLACSSRKTSELLNKVKSKSPITSFRYADELAFQYFKNEKMAFSLLLYVPLSMCL